MRDLHSLLFAVLLILGFSLSYANNDANWINIKGPLFYNDKDSWNATTATISSIIGQKGNTIWVYDGTKWRDTNFQKTGKKIKYWNILSSKNNYIEVNLTDGLSYFYNGQKWQQSKINNLNNRHKPIEKDFHQEVSQVFGENSKSPLILTKSNELWGYTSGKW